MTAKQKLYNEMKDRIAKGLDPLTGRPMETKGKIHHIGDRCVDETGREVKLDDGQWVYA